MRVGHGVGSVPELGQAPRGAVGCCSAAIRPIVQPNNLPCPGIILPMSVDAGENIIGHDVHAHA